MVTIINERDKLLQATSPRVISTDENYISITANSTVFTRVSSGIQPASIILTPRLNGKLKGIANLTWSVSPSSVNTYTVDSGTKVLTLPSSENYLNTAITFTAKLMYLGIEYIATIDINSLSNTHSISLSKDNVNTPTLANGSLGDYSQATSTATVLIGSTDDTANWNFSWVSTPAIGVTLGGPTNTNTISVTGIANNIDTAVLTVTATKTGWPPLTKQFTITKSKEGQSGESAPQVVLTSTGIAFITAKNTGIQSPETITFTATTTNIPSPTFKWYVAETLVPSATTGTFSLPKFSDSLAKLIKVEVSSVGEDAQLNTPDDILASDQITIYNLKEGDDSLQAILINESQTVSANSSGVVTSGLPATSQLILIRGSEILSNAIHGIIFGKVSDNGLTSTINAITGEITVTAVSAPTASGTYRVALGNKDTVVSGNDYIVTAIGTTTLNEWKNIFGSSLTQIPSLGSILTATATGNISGSGKVGAVTLDKKLNISKSVIGKDAGVFGLTNAGAVFVKAKDGTVTPDTITIQTSFVNVSNISYKWYKQTNSAGDFDEIANETSSSYIVSKGEFTTVNSNTYRCEAKGTLNGVANTIFTDEITVVRLDDGSDAITVQLSNETHSLPASSNGVVTSYLGSGTTIKVYQGAILLDYDGLGTSNGTWKIQNPITATNITVTNSFTESDKTLVVGNHSNFSNTADSGNIKYTIVGKNLTGSSFSIEKQQSFSKTKSGSLNPYIRITEDYTAAAGDRIIADTTNIVSPEILEITLPPNPVLGNSVIITDGGNFVLKPALVKRNGSTIKGDTKDIILDIYSTTFEFIYDGTTWQFTTTIGPRGDKGLTAKLLTLGTSSFVFIFENSTSLIANPQQITLTAYKQNLTGTPVFSAAAYSVSDQYLGPVTLQSSGDTSVLTLSNFLNTHGLLVKYVKITATLDGVSDTMSIVRGDNGGDGITHFMSNENHSVPAKADGQVVSFGGAFTDGGIFRGLVNETMLWTFTKTNSDNRLTTNIEVPTLVSTTGTISNIVQGVNSYTATISGLSSLGTLQNGSYISAVELPNQGALWQAPEPSSISVQSINSNNNSITYTVIGSGSPIAGPIGGLAIGRNWYRLTATGLANDLDVATATVTASRNGAASNFKTFTLVKSKDGSQGTTGGQGIQGTFARLISVSPNAFAFIFENATTVTDGLPSSITIGANTQNITSAIAFSATAYDQFNNSLGSVTLDGTGSTRTLTLTNFIGSNGINVRYVRVTATAEGLSDTVSIVRGDQGSDSITHFVDNESHNLPAASNGIVSSYAGAVCNGYIFKGLINETMLWDLTLNLGTGLGGNFTKPTRISDSGTVGSITGTGPWTAVISNMTSTSGLANGDVISAVENDTGKLSTVGGSPAAESICTVQQVLSTSSIRYTITGGGPPIAGPLGAIAKGKNNYTTTITSLDQSVELATAAVTASRIGYNSITKNFSISKSRAGVQGTGGVQGTLGVSPPLLTLSTTGFAFIFNSVSTTTEGSPDSIVLTATTQNLTDTPSFSATAYDSNNNSLGSVTLIGSGNSRTLTKTNFISSYATLVRYVKVVATIGTLSDTISIVRGDQGSDTITHFMDNENHTVPAYSDGQVTSYVGASTNGAIYKGLVNETMNWNITRTNSSGLTTDFTLPVKISDGGTVGSITGSGPWQATITGLSTTANAIAGQPISAIENSTGRIGSGTTNVTGKTTTTITYTSTGGTAPVAGPVAAVARGLNQYTVTVTSLNSGTDSATATIVASNPTYNSTYQKIFSISKSKGGSQGTTGAGLQGSVGTATQGVQGGVGREAALFYITNGGSAFAVSQTGTITPSGGITLETSYYNLLAPISYQWAVRAGATGSYVNISGATASSYTVPTSDYTSQVVNSYRCTITGTINGVSTNFADIVTIPKLLDGSDTVTIILSNEVHVFPATTAGAVSSYNNSGTTVRVFEGANELVYDGAGNSASRWTFSTTATNITVGAASTTASTYITIANHSGVADGNDSSAIVYNITGKRRSGTSFSISKTQTFGKSRTGGQGTQGVATQGTQGGTGQGAQGKTGAGLQGTKGLRTIEGYLYYTVASNTQPGAQGPVVSGYDFATGIFSTIPLNWSTTFDMGLISTTFPDRTLGGPIYWASRWVLEEVSDGTNITQSITTSPPFKWVNFYGLATFSNISNAPTGTGTSTTWIDGGNIKTNTLELSTLKSNTQDTIDTGKTFSLGVASTIRILDVNYPAVMRLQLDNQFGSTFNSISTGTAATAGIFFSGNQALWTAFFARGTSDNSINTGTLKNYVSVGEPNYALVAKSYLTNNDTVIYMGGYKTGMIVDQYKTTTARNLQANLISDVYAGVFKGYRSTNDEEDVVVYLAKDPSQAASGGINSYKYHPSVAVVKHAAVITDLSVGGYFDSRNTDNGVITSISLATPTHAAYLKGAIGTAPFTGSHDAMIDMLAEFEYGDIVVDEIVLAKNGISDSITKVRLSNSINETGVVGVISYLHIKGGTSNHIPAAMSKTYTEGLRVFDTVKPEFVDIYNNNNLIAINSLGEGQINVCGLGGNIEIGDFITSSNIPGKGMKQSDNIFHSYTVAKARESVVFSSPEEIKQIACIYHCG